jgi:DNA-binding IclR family transcriptional regulator
MSPNQVKSGLIQSIQRAASVLRSFTEAEPELGVMELSQRLGLHKSTVSRILSTLQYERLVGQNPETGKYRLGVGLVSLAGVALGRLDVRGLSQPHLNQLAELSEETVNLTIRDGYECVNIERIASPKPIQYVGWIGRRTPLHCTASGKVFLAHLPAEEREANLPATLTQFTEKTVVNRQTLGQSLLSICQQGYAIVHEEFEEGFSDIAAPIYSHKQQIVATVSISGPTFRMGPGQIVAFVEPLQEITRTISAEMGYRAGANG